MTFAQSIALDKPRIKRRCGFWIICGAGRYADSLDLLEAWRLWLATPPRLT